MVDLTLTYATFGLGSLIALIAAILIMRHKTLPPNAQLNDFQIKESSYIGRTVFGLAVFLGFAAWAVILFTKGSQLIPEKTLGWAIFSSLCALIGIFLTSYFWRQKSQGRHAVIQKSTSTFTDETPVYQDNATLGTTASLETSTNEADSANKQPSATLASTAGATAATAVAAAGLAASESNTQTGTHPITESATAQKQSTAETSLANQTSIAEPKVSKVPQDSVLRRHYLTKLRYEVEATLPPRPTDSVLKRHYETLLNAEMEKKWMTH